MAAHRRYDHRTRYEIRRRRRAGETFTAIAADLRIPRGTVSRLHDEEEQLEAAEAAAEAKRLAREQAERERRAAILAGRRVSFSAHGEGAVFYDVEHREDYFFARSLESHEDWLNWNDVCRGRLTPAERRAISKSRPLFAVERAKKPKAT